MTRILTIIALLFATPACAGGDDRYNLGDGSPSEFYFYEQGDLNSVGRLIKQEKMRGEMLLPSSSQGVRFLYSSTSGLNPENLVAVSGAVFLPKGEPPKNGWPLLSWSHGTVGIADKCAPSWDGYPEFHRNYLSRWLDAGFAIVASDYEGLGVEGTHPYLATRPAAFSNLDAIRAVRSAGFPVSSDVFLLGQSQGAAAALATAGHAMTYASEIIIRGVVLTGVPFFSPKALIAVREARPRDIVDPQLGYNFLALSLAQMADPSFSMNDYLSDKARPIAQRISAICNRKMRKIISEEKLTYNNSFIRSPNSGLEKAFKLMQYPELGLKVPIFIASGAMDKDTPLRMQQALVSKLCDAGSQVHSVVYKDKAHLNTLSHSINDAMGFVQAARLGKLTDGNCLSARALQ